VAGRAAVGEASRVVLVLWGSVGAVWELYRHGIEAATHDTLFHLYRLLDFSGLFEAGQFFPRLASSLGLGYGYATFTYYPPAAVYLGETFHLFGLGYIASLKASFAAGVLLGGFGTYLLARGLYGSWGATVAALAYAYVPYRLLAVYVLGDVAECLALGVLPLALWAVWRVATRPTPGRIAFAGLAVALLATSHLLTTLVAIPLFTAIVPVCLAQPPFAFLGKLPLARWIHPCWRVTVQQVVAIGATGLLGLAISAWYWLPVAVGMRQLNAAALVEGFFDFHQWFIPVDQLVQPSWLYDYVLIYEQGLRFNVGRVQALLFVLSVGWVLLARPKARSTLAALAGVAILLVWMLQDGAVPVWEKVSFLRFVQFPHRLEGPIGLVAALLLGSFWSSTPGTAGAGSTSGRLGLFGRTLGVVALVAAAYSSLPNLPRVHEVLSEPEVNVPELWRIEIDHQRIGGTTQGDYVPESSRGDIFNVTSPAVGQPTNQPPARVTAQEILPFRLTATTSAAESSSLTLDRFAYPGWVASIDGQAASVQPSGPLGLVTIRVPAGEHRLTLAYAGAPADSVGIALLFVGLTCVALIALAPGRPHFALRLAIVLLPVILLAMALNTRVQPPHQLGVSADFGDAFRLVGATLAPTSTTTAGTIQLDLLWEALTNASASCDVRVRLLNSNRNVVARRDKAPLFGLRPCSTWRQGEIVHDLEQIRLPPGVAGGSYRLAVGLTVGGVDLAPAVSARSITWQDSDASGDGPRSGVDLGLVGTRAASGAALQLVDGRAVGASVGPAQLVSARVRPLFHPVVAPPDQRFIARISPDDRLGLDVLWRALADTDLDAAIFTQLLDANSQLVAQDDGGPDRWFAPTSTWFPGDTLVDHRALAPKKALTPGLYRIVVGMYDRSTMARQPTAGPGAERDQVVLGTIKVTNAEQRFGNDVALAPVSVELGSQIRIIGARVESDRLRPGDVARVDVGWQALIRPLVDYTAFVHLLSPDGQLVSQHDSPPLAGTLPTTAWDAGDSVYDAIELPIPSDLLSGEYRVELGLYQPGTGARLADASGQDAFAISTIVVQ
jgi:hypothetical protein